MKVTKLVYVFLCVFLFATAVMATSYNCLQSGEWSNSVTWGDVGVPTLADNAYINFGRIVDVNFNAAADIIRLAVDNGESWNAKLRLFTPGVTLTVSGGLDVGHGYPASVLHSAGTVIVNTIYLGYLDKYKADGYYYLTGGTSNPLNLNNHAFIGYGGKGFLTMGDQTNSGVINFIASGKWFEIRDAVGSEWPNPNCKVEGWGVINCNNTHLQNYGYMIANGWGNERTLDASGFIMTDAYLNNAPYEEAYFAGETTPRVKNDGKSGWYAANKGKLLLPAVAVSAGSGGYNWGEKPSDTLIDMVNSAHLVFSNAVAGNLGIALVAATRTELHDANAHGKVIGAWQFSGANVLSNGSSLTFTVRYDHALAASSGIAAADLKMYLWDNTANEWKNVTTSIDETNMLITGTVNSLTTVVVGDGIVPTNCQEWFEFGYGMAGDLDQNCRVNTKDLDIMADKWLDCSDPDGAGCTHATPVPAYNYNAPESSSIAIDGSLTDWAGSQWVNMDQVYYGGYTNDVTSAKYACKWNSANNVIYLAVEVVDTARNFVDSYNAWNNQDFIEVYCQGDNAGGAYTTAYDVAQQYAVGANTSGGRWQSWGNGNVINETPNPGLNSAVTVSGDTIRYEAVVIPYDNYGGRSTGTGTTVITPLEKGKTIGFDVIVGSKQGVDFSMYAANLLQWKSNDADKFAHVTCVAAPGNDRCGEWGYYDADLNKDCNINFIDFADLAIDWFECDDPAGCL